MKSVFKLLARVNRHFVPVPIRKQGKKEIPIAPEGATAYYVRFTKDGKRTTNALGKNLAHAFVTLKNYELGQAFEKAGMEIPPEITTEKSMTILEARDKYFADRKGLAEEWDLIDEETATNIIDEWVRLAVEAS